LLLKLPCPAPGAEDAQRRFRSCACRHCAPET
jgi:hypothetical protein